jgi:hypothetical protein
LDLADEAKLNELVAVHQKSKDYNREYYLKKRVERHRLQKLVENGKQLDLADEAKLDDLVAAHQKSKDHDREYYQNNRVERRKWIKIGFC